MCLAKVFTYKKGEEDRFLIDGISHIDSNDEEVRLTSLLGDQTVLHGKVATMNLVNNIVRVELEQ